MEARARADAELKLERARGVMALAGVSSKVRYGLWSDEQCPFAGRENALNTAAPGPNRNVRRERGNRLSAGYLLDAQGGQRVAIGIVNTWRGNPAPRLISTSDEEGLYGTLRQNIRRMTHRKYSNSKSLELLQAALVLFFAHFNCCRVLCTLRVTLAMEAELTDHVRSMKEMARAA